MRKPKFIAFLFTTIFICFFIFDPSQSIVGHLLEPALGDPEKSGFYGRCVTASMSAVLLVLNLLAISWIPNFRLQVITVWLQLLILFLSFFYSFDLSFEFIRSKIWFMVTQGIFTTLYVSAISIVIASFIAIIGAVAKMSSNGFAYAIASFYTSFFRGLPLLMQVYLIYLGFPQIGYVIDAVPAGIIALSLCYGAYMTEIFRAGIMSIDHGQWEGSRALGFKFGLIMRKIILPQSIPLIIPPTGNQFIAMLKDSSLVSVIGVWELMFLARTLGNKTFNHMEMLITAAMLYWMMTMVLELIQSRIERKYKKQQSR
ncbi:amino acid ABC transporter permease [Oceanospirillaceae bacterium]|jgi:polar amino acid transport system permease protein|nr:amino acid ABC transporter permease [Oceanospirillaceae bacterium]MDC0083861.1 amino acid ABC transporter permease [Oceanospirillaceae bacterium]MDC1350627.1 amino acid ABC transporter permease [Oceanospirillaceae bacterium]MDC1506186.1 amino acid ABC transporter permease [Oceanospirillaceae bacterium]|tara:strand:+ start:888 stop:1829 length:942 start_codon:yes stop_codon:yes gene_type:complete